MLMVAIISLIETNSMKDRCFLDSNILVYAYTNLDLRKQELAQNVANSTESYISTQVCTEFVNVMRKKFKWSNIQLLLANIRTNFPIHSNTDDTIADAVRIAAQYQFSWYDSLIVSAALETGSQILYSEDLTHGQIIDKKLLIQNPLL
jgi:predicted nucleic acid-binding protein